MAREMASVRRLGLEAGWEVRAVVVMRRDSCAF